MDIFSKLIKNYREMTDSVLKPLSTVKENNTENKKTPERDSLYNLVDKVSEKNILFPNSYSEEDALNEVQKSYYKAPKYKILDSDEEKSLLNVFEQYKEILPFLNNTTLKGSVCGKYSDSEVFECLQKLSLMKEYVGKNFLETVEIHKDKPVDEAFVGSTARVYDATLENGEKVVAKVLYTNDIKDLTSSLEEGLHVKVAGDLKVGPKFHGYYITKNNEIAVVMDKINGFDIFTEDDRFESGKKVINNRTLDSFTYKMNKLHKAGYTFNNDAGQYLIGRDGTLYFMDIYLTKLDNGKFINFFGKQVEPTETEWYREQIDILNKYKLMAQKENGRAC